MNSVLTTTFHHLSQTYPNPGKNQILQVANNISPITNFIQSYLHQIFDNSHGLKASLKPLRRPFDQCQSRFEAINNGRDIKQINW